MKKIIFAVSCLFSSLAIAAGGPYDGIWYSEMAGYISVHENNGTIVVIRLSEDMSLWDAHIGPRNGATFRVETIMTQSAHSVINVTMTSDTTFSAIQESCYPRIWCLMPDGAGFSGTKVW
jgi:hypothetical protein